MDMDTSERTPQLTKQKKILFFMISYLMLTVLLVAGAELILRLKGFKPWRKVDFAIQVDPGGRLYTRHPSLGYSHISGRFTVTLGTGYSYHVTHLPNTRRITHPIDSYDEPRQKEEIWIFGCSYTHGWSLNDEETYPWLLQERLPEYEVVNFGVGGYGTIHSLIQFRDTLEAKTPKVAVLAYAGLHDVRNTFLRIQRKSLTPYNKLGPLVQPYARLDEEGRLRYSFADVIYPEFPLMRHLALAHYIETKYNELERRLRRSHAVSEALVVEMARLAKKHGVKFIIAGITKDDATLTMLEFAQKNEIPSIDISVDPKVKANTNLPHDGHPSAFANKQYADKLEAFLVTTTRIHSR
jgi:hypothetical protein